MMSALVLRVCYESSSSSFSEYKQVTKSELLFLIFQFSRFQLYDRRFLELLRRRRRPGLEG